MFRTKFLNILMSLLVIASMTLGSTGQVVAQSQAKAPPAQQAGGGNLHGKVTPAERQAAADRLKAAYKQAGISTQAAGVMDPLGVPDYFGTIPNYANSPLPTVDLNGVPLSGTGIRKFMDGLPGLGPTGANNLGQYIPVAVADTTTYPGSEYYEIALVQYTEKMNTDLPPTTLRGYVQISTGVVPGAHIQLFYPDGVTPILDYLGQPVYAVDNPHYLGPAIVAQSYDPSKPAGVGGNGQPTRIKFTNYLPAGAGGDLFIPTDTTYMGAGMGPTGEVTGISITSGGAGYASVPTVTISGGGATTDATAVATILNGVVNSLHITNPGEGYSSAPSVSISGGGASTDATASLSWIGGSAAAYTENRAVVHLHGGNTPWISDGTPNQWTTPATENTPYPEGVSVMNVPDMPDPGPGSLTLFYTNEQSARLMFYHDHAYGTTRLNVYAGEAAAYLVQDSYEQALMANGTLPPFSNEIPLVIQDKTFVPDTPQLANEDPTWDLAKYGGLGNLWFPHVYMPNQNPYDMAGVNAFGRWDYGPWFWPPLTGLTFGPLANPLFGIGGPLEGPVNPGTPNPSGVPEGFMDTPLVNGTAYPVLNVQPQAYRFRILNAANDRFFNLQLYQTSGIVSNLLLLTPGSGYTNPPAVTITNGAGDITGKGATALATVDLDPASLTYGTVTGISLWTVGSGYTANPTITIAAPTGLGGVAATASAVAYTLPTEVGMVPFNSSQNAITPFPASWYDPANPFSLDDRNGGVPDPTTRGPAMVQVGTEGGLMPNPAVIKNQPVNYVYNRRDIVVLNVAQKALFMGPAERADVVVDFSNFAGKTLIMYNDAPAPVPASDPRNDYFTGSPDLTSSGGAPSTLPGYGPNTRTIMQIVVAAGASSTAPVDDVNAANLSALQTALPATFAASQPPIIVGQTPYNTAYGATFPTDAFARIQSTSMNITPANAPASIIPMALQPKAIQELFTLDYGRMNATLGVEIPNTNFTVQTTIPLGYIDPATELLQNSAVGAPIGTLADGTQLWKITHNGVDTHAMHFHMFNVQVINRVGWDGAVRPPEANEIGWKDTVRMNPLEDVIVAFTPIIPVVPFQVPNSIRAIDVTRPIGSTMGFGLVDPSNNPSAVVNKLINFGWEYVWHCHLLGHEENDMMRPMMVAVAPVEPSTLTATPVAGSIILNWVNNATNATTYAIERATDSAFLNNLTPFDSAGNLTTFTDSSVVSGSTYYYRIAASNVIGGNEPGYPSMAANSAWVGPAQVGTGPAAPTALTATPQLGGAVLLSWFDNATNETSFIIQRSSDGGLTFPAVITVPATLPAFPGTGTVTYTDTTSSGANTYIYQVLATNAIGDSAPSNQVTVVLPAPPTAPTTLAAVLQAGPQVQLTWVDTSTNEDAFLIERKVNGGAFAPLTTTAANVVSYIDTTTTASNTYDYQVRAGNTGGYSGYTNIATVLVSLPADPTNLVGVLQAGPQVTLSWNDNSTNETGYVVERADNGGAFATLVTLGANPGTGLVGYIDATTLGDSSYIYRVKAVNILGSSAYSNSVSILTPPNAPSSVVATLINGAIQLTWTDNSVTETSFLVARNANGAGWVYFPAVAANPGTGTVTFYDFSTAASTSYQYGVFASSSAGLSTFAFSNVLLTSTAPAAPNNLTATLQNGGLVLLRWTDRSTNETGFQVERSVNGGAYAGIALVAAKANSNTTVSFTDATALAGNSNSYRVKAVRLGSSSAYSNIASVTLPALPVAPTGLTALPAATRAVTLSWTDNAMTEAGFSIERSVNGGAFAVLTTLGAHTGTGVMTYSDRTAVAGTAYVYQVRAYNLGGYSAYTNTAAITPAAPTVPGSLAASAIQTSATATQVTLTWTDPLTETSFTVQRMNSTYTAILGTATLPANQLSYTRNGLARLTTYYYEVRANNGYGSSAWARVSITTP